LDTLQLIKVQFFMSKYSIDLKLEVIDHYLSGNNSFRNTAERFGVGESDARKWVAAYQAHGAESLIKRYTGYTVEFKISVVLHMEQHDLSHRSTAAHFNIPAPSSILQWRRLYNAGNLTALVRKQGRLPAMDKPNSASTPDSTKPTDTRTREELLEELEYLRVENLYLKKLDALLRAKQQAALALKKKRK
jgi:transposase